MKKLILIIAVLLTANPAIADTPAEACQEIRVMTEVMSGKMPRCQYINFQGKNGYEIEWKGYSPKTGLTWAVFNTVSADSKVSSKTNFIYISDFEFRFFLSMVDARECVRLTENLRKDLIIKMATICFLNKGNIEAK